MRRYKYLDDLGVKREDQMDNWISQTRFDKRSRKWRKQRRTYGIDERSTWNWDKEYMDYIYIHLKMFYKVNMVDFNREYVTFEGKKISVQKAMNVILRWFETDYYPDYEEDLYTILRTEDFERYKEEVELFNKNMQKMLHLFAEIIPHLSW